MAAREAPGRRPAPLAAAGEAQGTLAPALAAGGLAPTDATSRRLGRRGAAGAVPAAMAAAMAVLTLLVHGYRLASAPDIFSDEALYLLVATNLARGAGLVDNFGLFFWHPPLFMVLEAAYIRLAGLADADVLTALYSVRWINVVVSAATAALLVLFGHRLAGRTAGLLMGGLFLLDPYVERINRRAMLETLAMFLALLGFYLFVTSGTSLSSWRQSMAAVAFGLAMLTKELMAFELVALVGYAAWADRSRLRAALWVSALACLPYVLYAVWAIAIGQWGKFVAFKILNLGRYLTPLAFLGRSDIEPGVAAARASDPLFWETLRLLIGQYVMSYALIGAAGLLTLVMLRRRDERPEVRLLAVWSAVSFVVIGFGLTLGRISDQFLYYVTVPAIAVVGYWLATRAPRGALVTALLIVPLYNGYQWADKYAFGSDDSYSRVYRYVVENVPEGATIVAGGDLSNYLFGDRYRVRFHRDTRSIDREGVRYFVMSSKEGWGRHNRMTPELYGWVMEQTTPLFEEQSPSFWTLGVYHRAGVPEP